MENRIDVLIAEAPPYLSKDTSNLVEAIDEDGRLLLVKPGVLTLLIKGEVQEDQICAHLAKLMEFHDRQA